MAIVFTSIRIASPWLAGVAVASASIVVSPTSSHSSSPQLPWTEALPLILANASGDTVTLESPTVRRQVASRLMMVSSPRSHASWTLLDGSTLKVDEHTPAGHHVDLNGDDIWVQPGNSYPRYVQAPVDVEWVVDFDVRTPVRAGMLVSRTAEEALPSVYLDVLALARYMALTDADSTSAIECSEDGPTRSQVRLSPERRLPLVVSWFAYEGDHLRGVNGLRRVGNRVEWRAENAGPPRHYPWALYTHIAPSEPRLVGRVLVDPVSKTITVIH